jgi:solute carrier family 35, member E2
MLGEVTNNYAKLTLLPVVIGLALCSSFEIDFSLFGFIATILNNTFETLRNVLTKILLNNYQYSIK